MDLARINYNVKNNVKYSTKPVCSVCSEDFDSHHHIPKVLECGHTICLPCIEKIIASIQVSYSGDGDVEKSFSCTICKKSMVIPSGNAKGFATNYQLIDVLNPIDKRVVSCIECDAKLQENAFFICRECTIYDQDYDICDLLKQASEIKMETYAICSTCTVKNHRDESHTLIPFLPLRIDWQFRKYLLTVGASQAELDKKFGQVRLRLANLPHVVAKVETQISDLVDFMSRAKCSQMQELVFLNYSAEMKTVTDLLTVVETGIAKVEDVLKNQYSKLVEKNEMTEATSCVSVNDFKSIEKLLSEFVKEEPEQVEVMQEIEEEEETEEEEPANSDLEENGDWKQIAMQYMHTFSKMLLSMSHQLLEKIKEVETDQIVEKFSNIDPKTQLLVGASLALFIIILFIKFLFF